MRDVYQAMIVLGGIVVFLGVWSVARRFFEWNERRKKR